MFNLFKKQPKPTPEARIGLEQLADFPFQPTATVYPKWEIDKSFSFCYGHRVWTQQLISDYCEAGDTSCKCKHLHGHEGLVRVFLSSNELERGMVTDFKHLGWLKDFLDKNLDHKFILDLNDPWFANIINAQPVWIATPAGPVLVGLTPTQPLNTSEQENLSVRPVYVNDVISGDRKIEGYNIDVLELEGPEREFFEGFFLVNFVPTSENLSRWLYLLVSKKMNPIGVHVTRVEWNETPKSRASYSQKEIHWRKVRS